MNTIDPEQKWWLPEAFGAASQGLGLSPKMLHKMNCEVVLAHLDEPGLSRLVRPLHLTRPAAVSGQLVLLGGTEVLFSHPAQTAMASWGTKHQAISILREVMQAVSALLKAHRQGELVNPPAIIRALPVLGMCNFTTGGEILKQDLAGILGCSSQNVPGLIRSYKIAALLNDKARVSAVDKRILADPDWSAWTQVFLQEGYGIIRLARPVTQWEFSPSPLSDSGRSSICQWLFHKE